MTAAADYIPKNKADARAYADFIVENFEPYDWPKLKRPRKRPSDGLLTLREAAARLGISDEQLTAFVRDGALPYINAGRGKLRPRIRFTPQDLDAFIERQRETQCRSTESRTARSSISTSSSNVIGFMARRSARLAAKPKPSRR